MKVVMCQAMGELRRAGFTLIELLVAMALVAVMCLLLLKLVNDTQGAAGHSLRRLDADSQAQLALDRMSLDLKAAAFRSDLPGLVTNTTTGGPSVEFFVRTDVAKGKRELSLVSYRLAKDNTSGAPLKTGHFCLQRASKGVDWAETNFMGLEAGNPPTLGDLPASLQIQDGDYDVLADGVIRMAVTCQTRDGLLQRDPPVIDGNPDWSQIRALVVTVVVIDDRSLLLLKPDQVNTLAAKFPDPTPTGVPPKKAWAALADNPANFSGLPRKAVESLRVYQRFFPIPNPKHL